MQKLQFIDWQQEAGSKRESVAGSKNAFIDTKSNFLHNNYYTVFFKYVFIWGFGFFLPIHTVALKGQTRCKLRKYQQIKKFWKNTQNTIEFK